jgi:hypothetical protein
MGEVLEDARDALARLGEALRQTRQQTHQPPRQRARRSDGAAR